MKTTRRNELPGTGMAARQKDKEHQALAGVGRQWNPRALLEGTENGVITSKENLAVPQKVKRRVTLRPRNSISGIYPKELNMST